MWRVARGRVRPVVGFRVMLSIQEMWCAPEDEEPGGDGHAETDGETGAATVARAVDVLAGPRR